MDVSVPSWVIPGTYAENLTVKHEELIELTAPLARFEAFLPLLPRAGICMGAGHLVLGGGGSDTPDPRRARTPACNLS